MYGAVWADMRPIYFMDTIFMCGGKLCGFVSSSVRIVVLGRARDVTTVPFFLSPPPTPLVFFVVFVCKSEEGCLKNHLLLMTLT